MVKNEATQPVSKLDELAGLIGRESAAAVVSQRHTLDHQRAAGQALIDAKAELKKLKKPLGKWLEANCKDISQQTAHDYMLIAREWDRLNANSEMVGVTSVRGAKQRLKDLDREAEGLTEDDYLPEYPEHPVTKLGDYWLLGENRLLCADSTNAYEVSRLMGLERAILFQTDPPYGVEYDGTSHPGGIDRSDNYVDGPAAQSAELHDKFIAVAVAQAIQPAAAWYMWHASTRQKMVEEMWNKHDAFMHQQIIWVKDRRVSGRLWYDYQHEPCFMGWIKPHKPEKISTSKLTTVWNVDGVPRVERFHGTPKPVKLFAIPIRQHTRPSLPSLKPFDVDDASITDELLDKMTEGYTSPMDLCYEPFAGSGTQIIAAEKLYRRCYAMEIVPANVEWIVRRWEAYTGGQAELIARADGPGPDIWDAARHRPDIAARIAMALNLGPDETPPRSQQQSDGGPAPEIPAR